MARTISPPKGLPVTAREAKKPMEFVEAVRLVYQLTNGMELMVDVTAVPELQRQARRQSEALDLICEWLHAHRAN